jgi:hypothetical protein
MYGCADELFPHDQHEEAARCGVNEYEASLVIKSGAELLSAASSDPRSEEGYTAVKANISESLNRIAEALTNFEAGSGVRNRSTGWVQDLRRVADDLVDRQG